MSTSHVFAVVLKPPPLGHLLDFGATLPQRIIQTNPPAAQPLSRLPSSSHVQLQLLPGQVWPQGEGASAPIQREELRLLHEDHLPFFLSDPVPHHRLSGALPHLRTTRTISGGEESQGKCEDPPTPATLRRVVMQVVMSMCCGSIEAGGGLQQAEQRHHQAEEGEERAGRPAGIVLGQESRRGEGAGEAEERLQLHRVHAQAESCKCSNVSAPRFRNRLSGGNKPNPAFYRRPARRRLAS